MKFLNTIVSAILAVTASSPLSAAKPVVGVNFNGLMRAADLNPGGELELAAPKWVRGFVDMRKHLGASAEAIAADVDIAKLRAVSETNYSTILSLKWPFENNDDFPTPGAAMEPFFVVMRNVLSALPGANIVVVGNEPFRETKQAFRDDDLVWFYKRMANEVNLYRTNNNRQFELYMGSFNNVHLPEERTAPLNALIDFAAATSWIAGVDLHEHHVDRENVPDALAWVRSRIPAAKKIILTEFSLMRHYKAMNSNTIPAAFAAKYGYSASMKAFEYLDKANKNPVPNAEWLEYMSSTPWIYSRRKYLSNMYAAFQQYDVNVATYGMRQPKQASVTADTDPWSYNGLFCAATCKEKLSWNYANIDEFRAIQG